MCYFYIRFWGFEVNRIDTNFFFYGICILVKKEDKRIFVKYLRYETEKKFCGIMFIFREEKKGGNIG